MAKHRAEEPTPDALTPNVIDVPDVPDVLDVLDVEIVPLEAVPASEPLPSAPVDTGYTPGGVPTFESVREKIETRFGTAIGASELAAETPEGRSVEEQYDARQRAAAERLDQIRKSMHDEPGHS
jgi:hypothetical protein